MINLPALKDFIYQNLLSVKISRRRKEEKKEKERGERERIHLVPYEDRRKIEGKS